MTRSSGNAVYVCGFGPFGPGREVTECVAVVSVGGVERSRMICEQTGRCVPVV